MALMVLTKRGQRRGRGSGRPSLLGNGQLERIRSTSLALLGLSTAVGLGLIAVALQQSWPVVPDLPLPASPRDGKLAISGQVAVSGPAGGPSSSVVGAPDADGNGGSRNRVSATERTHSSLDTADSVAEPVAGTDGGAVDRPPEADPPAQLPVASPPSPVEAPAPGQPTSPSSTPEPATTPPVTAKVTTPSSGGSKGGGRWRSREHGGWRDYDRPERVRGPERRDESPPDRGGWSDDDETESDPPSYGDDYEEDDSDEDDDFSDHDDRDRGGHGRGR